MASTSRSESRVRFTGSAEIVASRDAVWQLLIDPSRLGPCSPLPIKRVGDGRYSAQAQVGSGFLSTTLALDLEVTDVVEGRSARILTRGGASGVVIDSSASLAIRADSPPDRTLVDYDVELNLSGTFGGAASSLIEGRGPEAIRELTACISRQLGG